MRAGLLRNLVTIEQRGSVRSSFGSPTDSWAVFATVRADISPLNGRELEAAQKMVANVNTEITIRYLIGVVPEMRVNWNDATANRSRLFDIASVIDEDQRHHKMTLMCVERDLTTSSVVSGPTATIAGYGRKSAAEIPNGVRTTFTLPYAPNPSVMLVAYEGAIQTSPEHYTVSGAIVTFTFAPAVSSNLAFYF